jgi:DNA-3-methyladenine glycosylase II
MSGEQLVDEASLIKAMMVDGQTVVFKVEAEGQHLRYELFSSDPLSTSTGDSVAERISFFLSLQDDVNQFYSIARERDPKFSELIDELRGLHHVKFMTFLEASCWAVMSQRIQRPIALRMKRSLTERFGGSLEVDGRTYWAFPDRSRLAAATARELLEATRNQRTTERLVSLLMSLDELDESFLRTAPLEKAEARLMKVNGIGEWSSQLILFRGLGRIEKLQPINVRLLGETIKRVYGSEEKTLDEINKIYGSWSGYWSLYLRASS